MPKTNKPLVRDGRIQVQKKRTDRSYLRPASATDVQVDDPEVEETAEEIVENEAADAAAPEVAAPAAEFARPMSATATSAPAPRPTPSGKLPTTVRAIQQQGVRKRREVDLGALARRDTSYAYHELRRITILAVMVIVTLIVLWVVLR